MAVGSVLYFLAFLTLQASSHILQRENITVLEGESVVLNCMMDISEKSFIEWTNPQRHVIYFNDIQGLKDRRYKLVHYSNSTLIVTLLKTTVEDDGMYTCLYYGHQIITKQVYLTVLAPPSPPVLNVTKHLLKGREETVISCITTGSKPKPQITWLLNNRLELHGHTEHKPENKAAKFTTISMLKIKAHDQESRVDCLVRHESLMNKTLRATFRFDNDYSPLGPAESYTQTENEMNTTSIPESATDSELSESVTQENSTQNTPTANYIATIFIPEPTAVTEQPETVTEEDSTQDTPKTNYDFLTSTEDSTLLTNESETKSSPNSTSRAELLATKTGQSTFQSKVESSTSDNSKLHNLTEDTRESDAVSETTSSLNSTPSTELPITEIQQSTFQNNADSSTSSNSNPINSTENNTETNGTIFNSTTAWRITNSSSLELDNTTSTAKCENNQIIENKGKHEKQQMKQSGALLLILVAFLICALLIVFQLFVLKLRKEHLKWRKQKDDSDLTVESNRSNKSSNEENVRPESNNREHNFGMHCAIQINSEEQMKQYSNYISEDDMNTLEKESTV
ncbi:cytotoxic and regulatory T-cell molecule-like isoform X10 [Heptranchias perlo]|uniref:cytotoxic and regulatory T-cell molecule-like isoform X10 n=1 Tax=Heptranchias perlo TaxID=212740 RepID=UPI00355A20BE